MKRLSCFLLIIIPAVFFSCAKEQDDDDLIPITCDPSSNGLFTASINSQSWTACQFKAVYYPKDKLVTVKAIDNRYKYELRFFIMIDSITSLKTYTINSTSNSGLEIIESIGNDTIHSSDIYLCDLVKPGQGGTFVLSKLDTVNGTMSATFNITGYSRDQTKNIELTNGSITNAKLTTSSLSYENRSSMSATINGVNWYSNQVFAKVMGYLVPTPAYSWIEVRAMGYSNDLGDCPEYNQSYGRDHFLASGRNLVFDMPLYLPLGTYPLETANQFYPTRDHFLFSYNHHDFNDRYYPIPGSTISVTNIDTANKRINITFSTQVKDAAGNIFIFTNGKINLTHWEPF